AVKHFRRALVLSPDHLQALGRLGASLLALGEADEAVTRLRRVTARHPVALTATDTLNLLRLAAALEKKGDRQSAARHYQKACDNRDRFWSPVCLTEKETVALPQPVIAVWAARPSYLFAREDGDALGERIAYLHRAAALLPKEGSVSFALGVALHRKGDVKEALPHLRRAVELSPDNADAHAFLGSALREQGDRGEGMKHLHKAVRISPEEVFAVTSLAAALADEEGPDEALACLEKLGDQRLDVLARAVEGGLRVEK